MILTLLVSSVLLALSILPNTQQMHNKNELYKGVNESDGLGYKEVGGDEGQERGDAISGRASGKSFLYRVQKMVQLG